MTPTDRVRAALKHMRDDAMVMESEEGYKIAIESLALLDGHVLISIETLKRWRELVELNPQDIAPRIDSMIAPYVGREE